MAEQTYSVERDLKEARAMAEALDTYVRGEELYGRVGGGGMFGGGTMPSLTLGALLMRLRRLRALRDRLTPAQQQALESLEARHDAVRREWQHHYGEKVLREAGSRLDAMEHFFEECQNEPRTCANNYRPEALRLTIVQELRRAAEDMNLDSADLERKLRRADSRLRRYAKADGFLWDPALEAVYPRETFWWLWARPQPGDAA